MKTKKIKESNCCQKCGMLKCDDIALTTTKIWTGYITMCQGCQGEYEQEQNEKDELFKYICKKHDLFTPSTYIVRQVKGLYAQGYSYNMIKYFVWYTHVIRRNFKQKYASTINNVTYLLNDALGHLEINNIDINEIDYSK